MSQFDFKYWPIITELVIIFITVKVGSRPVLNTSQHFVPTSYDIIELRIVLLSGSEPSVY